MTQSGMLEVERARRGGGRGQGGRARAVKLGITARGRRAKLRGALCKQGSGRSEVQRSTTVAD
eukprot:747219-Hanusia_phi.AAC.5